MISYNLTIPYTTLSNILGVGTTLYTITKCSIELLNIEGYNIIWKYISALFMRYASVHEKDNSITV